MNNARELGSVAHNGRSAAWFAISFGGGECFIVALAAPELVQPLFIMKTGPRALEEARAEYQRAAECIASRERATSSSVPPDEPWDDETNFRESAGFDPLSTRWFDERS